MLDKNFMSVLDWMGRDLGTSDAVASDCKWEVSGVPAAVACPNPQIMTAALNLFRKDAVAGWRKTFE